MTLPPRAPLWVCDPNYLTCQNDHVYRNVKAGASLDLSRVTGYVWAKCDRCSSYWLGIVGKVGETTTVFCYAVTAAQWHDRGTLCADDVEPPELLRLLGFNPQYKRAA